jgi:hypothetical protein
LLLIFIGENALERSPVQVEIHYIGRGEPAWWQGRVEQLVDDPATRGANFGAGLGRRMRGDDDPSAWSCRGQKQIRAVKERSAGSCFGVGGLLVRWQGQAGLHLRELEEIIVLAAHDVGHSSQIGQNGPIAILAI